MYNSPIAPEAVLPLLRSSLARFRAKHGFTGKELSAELQAIAERLGQTGKKFGRTRLSRLTTWGQNGKTEKHVISHDEWIVFLHALPDFRNEIREKTIRWLTSSAYEATPIDDGIAKAIHDEFGVTAIVPKYSSRLEVFELASRHIITTLILEDNRYRSEPRERVIAITGGKTQEILTEFIGRQVSELDYHPTNIRPKIVALNDFHDPKQPGYNAASIVCRWAACLNCESSVIPKPDQPADEVLYGDNLEEPLLVVLGCGNMGKGKKQGFFIELASDYLKRVGEPIIGDVGGLYFDDSGKRVYASRHIGHFNQSLTLDALKGWCKSDQTEVIAVVPQEHKTEIVAATMKARLANRFFLGRTLARKLFDPPYPDDASTHARVPTKRATGSTG